MPGSMGDSALTQAFEVGVRCQIREAKAATAVLVIAGTDSSGGAGLTRDVRVLSDFGIDSLCAVTAVTAQTDAHVTAIHHIPPHTICEQIAAAFATRRVAAVKIGMLGNRATVEAVIAGLRAGIPVPTVLDPVLLSSSGGILLDAAGKAAMQESLFPLTTVITPNIPETASLLDEEPATREPELVRQAERLLARGARSALLKGGHSTGPDATDLLLTRGCPVQRITSPRLQVKHRGTGCSLAAAIAAGLASGMLLIDACQQAKQYVSRMLAGARAFPTPNSD